MITTILCLVLMFLVSLAIHFTLFKLGKRPDWWSDSYSVIVICVIGLLSKDFNYFAIILGHLVAREVAKFVGWIGKR